MIRFLVAELPGTREIRRRNAAVYGEHCMSMTSMHEWQKSVREGRTSLQDDLRPGQAHRAITPDVTARIHDLNRENRRITEEQIRVQVAVSLDSVHTIIKNRLQFRKICSQWVPHQMTVGQTIDRMAACLSHLQRTYEEEY